MSLSRGFLILRHSPPWRSSSFPFFFRRSLCGSPLYLFYIPIDLSRGSLAFIAVVNAFRQGVAFGFFLWSPLSVFSSLGEINDLPPPLPFKFSQKFGPPFIWCPCLSWLTPGVRGCIFLSSPFLFFFFSIKPGASMTCLTAAIKGGQKLFQHGSPVLFCVLSPFPTLAPRDELNNSRLLRPPRTLPLPFGSFF